VCPLSIVTVISDDLMLVLLTSVCIGYLLEGYLLVFHGRSFFIMQFWSYLQDLKGFVSLNFGNP
jgi:hypothetical protein